MIYIFFTFIISQFYYYYFLIYLLIMLLQLSHFPPSLHSILPPPSHIPHYSSCPWVILISSLASTFPTLFLPSQFYYLKNLLLFNYSYMPFLPIPPPHPSQTHLLPTPPPSPLILSMCPLAFI